MACVAAAYHGGEFWTNVKAVLVVESGNVRKAAERMVIQLQRKGKDAKAVGEVLRKFSKQPRATQIQVLERLLDKHDGELAVPVYNSLRKQSWYQWSPTLHARLAALLDDIDPSKEEQDLVLHTPENLSVGQELDLQVCLILNYGKYGHLEKALASFHGLQSHPSPRGRDLSYRALLQLYVLLNLPHKAYLVLQQMKTAGCSPRLNDYKAVLHKFGSGGHLADMEILVSELEEDGLKLDLSGFNMKLSAYAQAMNFESVIETLDTMRSLDISCSVNSRNAISKSCPALIPTLKSLEALPSSEASLVQFFELKGVSDGELQAIKQLVRLGIPAGSVKWEENLWELDLHQMFLGTAFVLVLVWLLQLRAQLGAGARFPSGVKIVTGWGKHTGDGGKSIILRSMVELLDKFQSPFAVDKHNRGVLSCRSSAVRHWLKSH